MGLVGIAISWLRVLLEVRCLKYLGRYYYIPSGLQLYFQETKYLRGISERLPNAGRHLT